MSQPQPRPNFAIIGGTGLCDTLLEASPSRTVTTRYGSATVEVTELAGQQVFFLPRHGRGHALPPHRINYRANIAALKELGVKSVLAAATVGSLNPSLPPESLVLLTQFLDFTKGRPSTFFDGEGGEVIHIDVTEPYCPRLREALVRGAGDLRQPLVLSATYVCTEGPRFETPVEIEMFRKLGGDIVGMTNLPEVVLAREAGLCYAAVGLVTNWAAGISPQPLRHAEVVEVGRRNLARVRQLFATAIALYEETECPCRHVPGPIS